MGQKDWVIPMPPGGTDVPAAAFDGVRPNGFELEPIRNASLPVDAVGVRRTQRRPAALMKAALSPVLWLIMAISSWSASISASALLGAVLLAGYPQPDTGE